MKRSLAHLPEHKQDELRLIVKIIRQQFPSLQNLKGINHEYIGGDFDKNSDLDIAIELDRKQGHIDGYALWISHSKEYGRAVKALLLGSNVHLEYYDKEKTPTVKAAVESSGDMVYSRDKDKKDEKSKGEQKQ